MTEKSSAIPIRIPMNDPELVRGASHFHPWDAMAPPIPSSPRKPDAAVTQSYCHMPASGILRSQLEVNTRVFPNS